MPTVRHCTEIPPTGSQCRQLPAAEWVTSCFNEMKRLRDSSASRPCKSSRNKRLRDFFNGMKRLQTCHNKPHGMKRLRNLREEGEGVPPQGDGTTERLHPKP